MCDYYESAHNTRKKDYIITDERLFRFEFFFPPGDQCCVT